MALCTPCDNKTMVSHPEPQCVKPLLGNSTSIAYICKAANDLLKVDYTDETVWNTILAGLTPQNDLVIVNRVTVSRTSENQTSENPMKGDGVQNLKTGETHTVTITDANGSVANHDFYNKIDGKRLWAVIAYKDGRMEVSPRPMMLMATTPAIEYGAFQSFTLEATGMFDKDQYWLPFATQPTGIFNFD